MSFQWLQMRISEEQDRRRKQAEALERLPRALDELQDVIRTCVDSYTQAFGGESADVQVHGSRIRVVVREAKDGDWQETARVEIGAIPALPGLEIERGGEPYRIEVGTLPGDKLYYRDCEQDQYLTMEELTRRILDKVLFPKLGD